MRDLTTLRRLFVLLLLSTLALACGAPPTANNSNTTGSKFPARVAGTKGGTLTYRITAPPSTFNYLVGLTEPTILISHYMMNSRPIEFDHSTQKYRAGLAESWTFGTDRQTVDMKLREGLKFSDGQPITTADLAFSLAAIYDPRTNAAAWKDSMSVNGKPIATKIIDERNIQFIFPEPVAQIDNYFDNLGVIPKHILNADLEAGKLAEAWKVTAAPETIVTSGPFSVESATAGERVVLKRNPHFWRKDEKGAQLPYLDKVSFEVVSDANQGMARLNQGTLDVVDRLRGADYAALLNSPGSAKAYDLGPGLGVDHIIFNLNKANKAGAKVGDPIKQAWFTDKRFRQAISSAIDRKTIATTTLQGLATPLYGFVSPANRAWVNPALTTVAHDLKRSEQLLTEAGFTKRGTAETPELFDAKGNRVEFSLIYPAENEPRKLMAAVIQEDLAKLGIKMTVVPVEQNAIAAAANETYDYETMLYGLTVGGIEPTAYANFLLSNADTHQWQPGQSTPATDWEARIDTLFNGVAGEADTQKRAQLFNEIQAIMADESPVVPIVSRHIVAAVNERVGNYSPSSIFPYSIWNIDEIFLKQ